MSSEEDYLDDEEFDPIADKNLLDGINRLGKTQRIRPPTRKAITQFDDGFYLLENEDDGFSLTVNDLLGVLEKANKKQVANEVKKIYNSKNTLEPLLEKPIAKKIQRSIGYEKIKKDLSRWDAVVARNRTLDHQVFPLDTDTVYINTGALKTPPKRSIKSDLMLEIEEIDEKLKEIKKQKLGQAVDNEEHDKKNIQERLTRDELKRRRKEIAYLRMKESQKIEKARLKNKIKSKKYHKLLKREKLKQQLKDFELLQKTNPDIALEQLEKLEKSRVQERASLRHKNTGTWAKNLQVRAKYDKDVRKDLAEQLAISRELTQKQKDSDEEKDNDDGDDDDDGNGLDQNNTENNMDYDPFNPWMKSKTQKHNSNEITDFISGYRKYWMERNENEQKLKDYNENLSENQEEEEKNLNENTNDQKNQMKHQQSEVSIEIDNQKDQMKSKSLSLKKKSSVVKKTKKIKPKKRITIENGWIVEDIDSSNAKGYKSIVTKSIDNIFDEAEDIMEKGISTKLKKLTDFLNSSSVKNEMNIKNNEKDELKQLKDLSFKESTNRPDFDEELLETSIKNKDFNNTKSNISEKLDIENLNADTNNEQSINPDSFTEIKPKFLRTNLPEIMNSDVLEDDENDNLSKNLTIAEAFEDDDIIADFSKERQDENDKLNQEIDLSLPGWGTWAGCGIPKEKQIKRFILKFPKDQPRKDENKEKVYINESSNKKLKEHLVSDIPFPFTGVKDYEASIRAPIGRSFMPETAFRMYTRPSVVTKKGHIIEPMNEDILVQPPKRPRTIVDTRIQKLSVQKKK